MRAPREQTRRWGARRLAPAFLVAAVAAGALSVTTLAGTGSDPAEPRREEPQRTPEAERPRHLGPALEEAPARVVSLSPALTATVIALGMEQSLVGVTRFCDQPEVSGVDRVGGFVDPSVEAVLSARPELVLAEPSPGNKDAVMQLATLGHSVLVVPQSNIAEVREALLAVAEALGVPEKGRRLLDAMDEKLEEVRRASSQRRPLRAALVFGREPLVLAGPGSFGDELLSLAGGANVASGARVPYPTYPLELLLAVAPEVIVETAMTAGRPEALPFLGDVRHVVAEGDALLRPGPGLADAARELFELLHDDAELGPAQAEAGEAGPTQEAGDYRRAEHTGNAAPAKESGPASRAQESGHTDTTPSARERGP